MDKLLAEIEHRYGPKGFKKILDALSQEENNWALAEQLGMSVFEVSQLRNNFPLIYKRKYEQRPLRLVVSEHTVQAA